MPFPVRYRSVLGYRRSQGQSLVTVLGYRRSQIQYSPWLLPLPSLYSPWLPPLPGTILSPGTVLSVGPVLWLDLPRSRVDACKDWALPRSTALLVSGALPLSRLPRSKRPWPRSRLHQGPWPRFPLLFRTGSVSFSGSASILWFRVYSLLTLSGSLFWFTLLVCSLGPISHSSGPRGDWSLTFVCCSTEAAGPITSPPLPLGARRRLVRTPTPRSNHLLLGSHRSFTRSLLIYYSVHYALSLFFTWSTKSTVYSVCSTQSISVLYCLLYNASI